MKKDTEPTISDVLVAINQFASHVDGRLDKVENRLDTVENQVNHISNVMVTKEYLDDRLFDPRREQKITATVNLLKAKQVITPHEAKEILALKLLAG